ncbi:MAG TPA: MFS transporter [Methanocella sp.]|nr:MFS transporter [Methanocella sp.]HTY91546.1 MFS transporter [Methanocella sp.]
MLCLSACSLLFMSFSWSSSILLIASFAVGFTSVVPQLIVPLAAQMADPAERGKIIGTVMSGLLIGILLSRTFSGFVGGYFGWQVVYWIASGLMVALALLLSRRLPISPPNSNISYLGLFKSMASLIKDKPVVREASLNGAMMFAAFSAFWTTLVFLLESSHYNMGTMSAEVAGLFGLVGVVGAAAAPIAGRIADQRSPRFTIWIGMAVVILSFLCFLVFGFSIWGLIVGVILLDLGVQSCQISNQARIHALGDESRNRLNTIYMVAYFIGGALGSFLASYGYSAFGWYGVCAVGLITQAIALAAHIKGMRHAPKQAINL